MRKFCYKKWVRWLASVICILSANLFVLSAAGCILLESNDVYDREEKEVKESLYEEALTDASVLAAAGYKEDFNRALLEKTNFRYAVLQGDRLDELSYDELNDPATYEVCTFDKIVDKDMLHVYSCDIGKNTTIQTGTSLWDSYWINNYTYEEKEVQEDISALYYDWNIGQLYVKAGDKLYDYYGMIGLISADDTGTEDSYEVTELQQEITLEETEADKVYGWKNPDKLLSLDEAKYSVPLSEVEIIGHTQVNTFGEIASEDYHFGTGSVISYQSGKYTGKIKSYYILSYVNDPLQAEDGYLNGNVFQKIGGLAKQDLFVQAAVIADLSYQFRYVVYGVMTASLLLALFAFCIFVTGAGHAAGGEKVVSGWLDRIPFDLFAAILAGIEILCIGGIYVCVASGMRMVLTIGIVCALAGEICAMLFFYSTAVRLKQKAWWKNMICYRICVWIGNIIHRFFAKIGYGMQSIGSGLPFLWKTWFLMGIFVFGELILLLISGFSPLMWLLEQAVLIMLLTLALLQMNVLKKGGERLAEGETADEIDTAKLNGVFRQHGENLNSIRRGIDEAVARQIKSERFRTELITNVSHDIKTPLTSIINYVDLLEKEQTDNPKVREYLEVLGRQSARLKKLIEDLLEASKASTGNLSVHPEECDARVILTQTIGEFEEKLTAGEITLKVQEENSVVLMADPRHLWRIFENLMNNICKYAQPSTRAYVNIGQEENRGRIIFRNISRYPLNIDGEELMERFVRGDGSRHTEGNGLGISIAKSLTELMGGTFELVVDGDLFKVMVTLPAVEK